MANAYLCLLVKMQADRSLNDSCGVRGCCRSLESTYVWKSIKNGSAHERSFGCSAFFFGVCGPTLISVTSASGTEMRTERRRSK
jgi:hypothetical protein